jgi:hypothetical protein
MRKTLTTAALLLALTCPSLAGEIHTPGSPTPPPPPTPITMQESSDELTLNGEIHTPGMPESMTEAALDLFMMLPSLF